MGESGKSIWRQSGVVLICMMLPGFMFTLKKPCDKKIVAFLESGYKASVIRKSYLAYGRISPSGKPDSGQDRQPHPCPFILQSEIQIILDQ